MQHCVNGSITSAERCKDEQDNVYDRIQFCFELHTPDDSLAARATIT